MDSFKDFFIIQERKTWGKDVLNAQKIAKLLIKKVLKGDLSLYGHNNSFKVQLPNGELMIRIKAFNNFKDEVEGAHAYYTLNIKEDYALIELFLFEIYGNMMNFRGQKKERLNDVMYHFFKNNYTTDVVGVLAHELQHAFESDRGASIFDKYTNKTGRPLDAEEYLNTFPEMNARVVQFIYPVNTAWSKEVENDMWNDDDPNLSRVKFETVRIMNQFKTKDYAYLTPENQKRFAKAVYTTLSYLWNHYSVQSKKNMLAKQLTLAQIETKFKDSF